MSLEAWGDDGGVDDPVHPDTLLEAGWWPSEDAEEALALMKGVLAARGSLVTLEVHLAKLRAFVEAHGPGVVLTPEPARTSAADGLTAPPAGTFGWSNPPGDAVPEEIGVGMSDKTMLVPPAEDGLRGPYADARRCKECGAAERRCCAGNRPYRTGCQGPWG